MRVDRSRRRRSPTAVAHAVVGGDVDVRRAGGGRARAARRSPAPAGRRSSPGRSAALTASIWRTRSSSFTGVVSSWLADAIGLRSRRPRRRAARPVCARPLPGQPIDVVAGLGVADAARLRRPCAAGSPPPWRRPPGRAGRSPDRGRSPAWRRGGSSTACPRARSRASALDSTS